MNYTFKIEGVTCNGCVKKVRELFSGLKGVSGVQVNDAMNAVTIETDHPLAPSVFHAALEGSLYRLSENSRDEAKEAPKASVLKTYFPLMLVLAFISLVAFLTSFSGNVPDGALFMRYFMAGFFLTFSFFKFLDLRAFAQTYAMYDVLAMKLPAYGYVYPFLELLLGIAFLTGFNPVATNIATIVVMGFSSIGVIQSVVDKKKIRCACLGAVFNLPMSSITIAEDLLMVAMSVLTLLTIS